MLFGTPKPLTLILSPPARREATEARALSVSKRVGRLAFSKGEGEGEGSKRKVKARVKKPLTLILSPSARGEATTARA
jgi:hypothetical protein